jgi:preprotein translocase subunit SecE
MNSIVTYFKESYIELKERVTWPTMPELQKLTTIVLVSLAIITIVILIMDQLSKLAIIDMFYGNI